MRRLPVLPALFLLGACSAPSPALAPASPAAVSPPTVSPAPARSPSVSPSPSSGPADPQTLAMQAARQDAATRLGVPADSLQIQDVQPRQWNDRSLGCPRPGVLYAQVVTPGYSLLVVGGGRRLEYHTDDRGVAVFCQER
jgi:hypothetical protein